MGQEPVVRFSVFEFAPRTGELRRQGRRVRLPNQSAELLNALLECPGEMVTREQLRKRIWTGGSFTDFEQGLNRAMHRLRIALSDSSEAPKFIETLPRRGYRFHYPLVTGPETNRRKKRMGVLPFSKAYSSEKTEFLGDALAERLTFSLASFPMLQVMAPSTMARVADKSPQDAGSELKLHAILSGKLQVRNRRIHLQIELLEVETGFLLWGRQIETSEDDLQKLQQEVTSELVEALAAGADNNLISSSNASGARTNNEAYRFYLQGRHSLGKRTIDGLQAALHFFEASVETDPVFAPAHSGIADCYALLSISPYCALRPREAMPRAKAAATRALELDPALAESYASLGLVKLFYEWDRLSAELLFRRALELNPSYSTAYVWYSLLHASAGRFENAHQTARYAAELDPLSAVIPSLSAALYYFSREPKRALADTRSLTQPGHTHPLTWCFLGMSYIGVKRYEEAIRCFKNAGGLQSQITPVLAGLGYALAKAGQADEVRKVFHALKKMQPASYVAPQVSLFLYLGLGEYKEALSWLERSVNERCDFIVYLDVDAAFDPLRNEPAFRSLREKAFGTTQED